MSTRGTPLPSGWTRELAAGETLFTEGDRGRQVFILMSGRVEISQAGARIGEIDTAEAVLGEIAALTGEPRSATVRTLEDSTVVVVPDVGDLFADYPAWGLHVASTLASRLLRVERRLEADRDDATARIFAGLLRGLD